jgi:hypothetical protein
VRARCLLRLLFTNVFAGGLPESWAHELALATAGDSTCPVSDSADCSISEALPPAELRNLDEIVKVSLT